MPSNVTNGSATAIRKHNRLSMSSGLIAATRDVSSNGSGIEIEKHSGSMPTPIAPAFSIYSTWQKRGIVLAASLAAFFSPMTQQIYYPALPTLAHTFNVSNSAINLTVTSYMVFQGLTPMFLGDFADRAGRRPTYIVCFAVYIAANIALARTHSYAALLGLRCLQAAGSSSTVALAFAIVADVVTSAERGAYISFTAVPVVLAPALGPVIGGTLAEYVGWRWIFWYLAIFSGIMLFALFMFLPETCRVLVGDGSRTPPRLNRTGYALVKELFLSQRTPLPEASTLEPPPRAELRLPNPLPAIQILFEKELGLLLLSSSLVFSGFYSVSSAIPSLFRATYGLTELQIGLMFLPLAAGSIAAAAVVGPLMNWNYRRHSARLNFTHDRHTQPDLATFPIERVRLQAGLPPLLVATVAIVAWGWAVHAQAHISILCVLMFVFGGGMVGYSNTSNALIVDVSRARAGTATAANNIARCLVGAGASAAVVPLIKVIGVNWAFTLVGSVYLAAVPMLLVIMNYGMQWRSELEENH
ncbi:Quinidine resistance protein 2 [Ceratocystis lukuohia]|uniref:Quinidine resistance protein 2 n=1 Tax=Ceratocystis lukuohia TaxID=2019550 RepID=A0ABR4MEQ0_9PEZI